MALHTGVIEERDGDYFGPPLNRIARLLAASHGGQTLLSLAAEELVREQLPSDADLRDLGTHHLKDLSHPEQIFQLVTPDLPADFPPLHTLDPRRTNLPAQPTALIGREQEMAAVCARLYRPEVRLLTLTGPGGTGKTRLGLQVAAELLDAFVDGVYFVDLAPIHDPGLVPFTIAQTLGLTESSDQSLLDRLHFYLRDKRLLLTLDNFEQVVDAAPLIAKLLAECPYVKVLVTSRVPLQVRGEQEIPVPPLALPDLHQLLPVESLTQYAAVQLFIQRARDVQPDFAVTNDNAAAVAEICYRLDGLPLAIELATTRIKLFPPQALLVRLGNRLTFLTGGARDLPARQQTLRSAIAWSYDLLEPGAQMLFARLGVFVGGCTLDAAAVVCKAAGDLLDVIAGLALLVDNSLVRCTQGTVGEPRFTMFETIREYALEQLESSGEVKAIRHRHAAHYLVLSEATTSKHYSTEQRGWLERLEVEHDNLRAALQWALEPRRRRDKESTTPALSSPSLLDSWSPAELGVRLVGALVPFWHARGYQNEGRMWLENAIAPSSGVAPEIQAMILYEAGFFATHQGDVARSTILFTEALALFRTLDDQQGIASILGELGGTEMDQGDYGPAAALLAESLDLYRALGDRRGVMGTLHTLGDIAREQGEHARACALLEESLAISRDLPDNRHSAYILNGLGDVAYNQGDMERARGLCQEAQLLAQDVGNKQLVATRCTTSDG